MPRTRTRKSENRRLKLYFSTVLDMGRAKDISVEVDTDGESKDKIITVDIWNPIPDGVDASVDKIHNPMLADEDFIVAENYVAVPEIIKLTFDKIYYPIVTILSDLGATRIKLLRANFTQPFPPMFICIPERDGQSARELTDEEITQMLEEGKDNHLLRAWISDDLRNKQFYEFIGGSGIESECWKLKRYSGINVSIQFIVLANSPILGYAMELTRRVASISRGQLFNKQYGKSRQGGNINGPTTKTLT